MNQYLVRATPNTTPERVLVRVGTQIANCLTCGAVVTLTGEAFGVCEACGLCYHVELIAVLRRAVERS